MSPIPATTGQYRTSIYDMEIGDYIPIKYTAASNAVGTFSDLGADLATAQANEIPVEGAATPDGYAYFIKVKKGILVMDRVVQHSISWNTLNAGKVIEGLPWDNGNIIPTMTSNTEPSGVASASSSYSYREPYKAFDKLSEDATNHAWMSQRDDIEGAWLAYKFQDPTNIKSYSLSSSDNPTSTYLGRMPRDWTFEGSNDGINWTILDEQKEISWENTKRRLFLIKQPKIFTEYRIKFKDNNGDASYIFLPELEMYDTVGTIRSLTGGVAYVDEEGNRSLTDQGFGGWPTVNEWDSLIVNFPIEKIQEGKTLDDVFHWSQVRTWTQNTPSKETGYGSTRRVNTNTTNILKRDLMAESNLTQFTTGFRPVFEYKES